MPSGSIRRRQRYQRSAPAIERVGFAREPLGGGYPVVSDVQGIEQVGTLGCLVTDGRYTYALTARHVAGRPGEPLYSVVKGERQRMGRTASLQAGDADLGRDRLTLDAGLVELEDLGGWSAQVFGGRVLAAGRAVGECVASGQRRAEASRDWGVRRGGGAAGLQG